MQKRNVITIFKIMNDNNDGIDEDTYFSQERLRESVDTLEYEPEEGHDYNDDLYNYKRQ